LAFVITEVINIYGLHFKYLMKCKKSCESGGFHGRADDNNVLGLMPYSFTGIEVTKLCHFSLEDGDSMFL
jgi:hypothetical protein